MASPKSLLFSCVAASICSLVAGAASAQAPMAARTGAVEARCSALIGNRFEQIADAPTQIVSAKIVKYDGVEFCEAQGYIAPQIGILMRLPTQTWNNRFLVSGCGGLCGFFSTGGDLGFFPPAQKRGYAVITTDMGHHFGSSPSSAKWALNNLMGEMDFGFRATHAAAAAGKAIAADFYGTPASKSYYAGCSTGGRQGLVSAQRYPNDFDGLVVGAPTVAYATSGFQLLWSAMSNLRADGSAILKRPEIERLHSAVIRQCDMNDGVADGLIGDPRLCKFEVSSLICKASQTAGCLTAEQAEAARRIYQGPVDSKGRKIHTGGAELGSELAWLGDYIDDGDRKAAIYPFMIDKFRYLTFSEDPGASWKPTDIDWDRDPARAAGPGSTYTATNPDLRRVRAAGAKIIQFHGWSDENVIPSQSYDYYDMVRKVMGGDEATQSFYRLFMLPGVQHCRNGAGADDVGYLEAIENWVEKGQAPDVLIGAKIVDGATKFSRPYYPYPTRTVYSGRGDPNAAASFKREPAAKK